MRLRIRSHLVAIPVACVLLGSAKTPPSKNPALEPKKQVTTDVGGAKLVPPLDTMVLLAGGSFDVGITDAELARVRAICGTEVLCLNDADKDAKGEPQPYAYPFAYERPLHTVFLDSFFVDRTEVTVAAYRRCVIAGQCTTPTYNAGDPKFDRDDFPVTHVSYEDATKYCAFRGGRLPTEAEWERTARGSTRRFYPWGDLPNPKLANHGALDLGSFFLPKPVEPIMGVPDQADGFTWLAPVGSFPSGATPEGVHDLAGNVAEWVSDWWADFYDKSPAANPKGPPSGGQHPMRVVRGGSYRHPLAMIRGSSRQYRMPSARESTIGFRCAKDAKPS